MFAPYCTGPVYGLPGQQEEQAHLVCFKAIWCLRPSEDSILYPKSIKGLLKTPRLVTLDVDGFDEAFEVGGYEELQRYLIAALSLIL